MERRSWPWKKKSSDKSASMEAASLDSTNADVAQDLANPENFQKLSNVKISVESYTRLTGMEDQVMSYKEQVQAQQSQIVNLNEKLSAAQEELVAKEALVKQHGKVAEEAISGWEKAEMEASTLKTRLEAVMLEKLTAEDRAAHLDSALKECVAQTRILKEEHEQELHDVIFSKAKQIEKLKYDLESKLTDLKQDILKSEAENAALARSLQERFKMLLKISDQKSQAEAEIERLTGNIESCEREIGSLTYEVHLAAKELEIRRDEKNMNVRSADVANKQHAEAIKKITKLEAECQRLRAFARKKLPGPAALAQMKLEVESLGRDYLDNRRRSGQISTSNSPSDFHLEELHKLQKENEFLTEQLLAMEEDTKMLKEALAKRNMELHDSRDLCATFFNKLQSVEAKTQTDSKVILKMQNALSLSMSEDGNEYTQSSAESWSTGINSDILYCKQRKAQSANHLDLMDDFLEMEKLACSSNNSNGLLTDTNQSNCNEKMVETTAGYRDPELQHSSKAMQKNSGIGNYPNSDIDVDQLPLMKLQSRISMLYDFISKESGGTKILEDMRSIVDESLHHVYSCCGSKIIHCADASNDRQICPQDTDMAAVEDMYSSLDSQSASGNMQTISPEITGAIHQINDFIVSLGKAAEAVQGTSPDDDGLIEKVKEFSEKFCFLLNEKTSLVDFVADLSHILHKANRLRFNFHGFKENAVESDSSDCIDKVVLPKHEVDTDKVLGDFHANSLSSSGYHPEVHSSRNPEPGLEVNSASCMCTMEDFGKLKTEKENLEIEFVRCTKDLENTQSQLSETEGKLSELKSQLDSAQSGNSIAETQLKCMVESYRTLERRAEELEIELKLLREETKKLEDELQQEKAKHQDALDRCNDLQDQLQRKISNSESSMVEIDHKISQEKELEAAAAKLSECQETIFLLGRQLKSFRPQPEPVITSQKDLAQRVPSPAKGELAITFENMLDLDRARIEDAALSGTVYRTGSESPMKDVYNALYVPTDSEGNSYLRSPMNAKHQKHKSTYSIPPAYGAPTSEKHSRSGISRFFSTKGKF